MTAVYKRELLSAFTGLIAYVFIFFILLFTGIYTSAINLLGMHPGFESVIQSMSFLFVVAIPILTMRSVADEKRQRTDQLLYALPLKMSSVVLGKFLSMVTVILIPSVIMTFYPLILSRFGTVSFETAYTALLGFFLLASSLASIGLFLSSLTENQAVAAGLCFVVMLLLYLMGQLATMVPGTSTASLAAVLVLVILAALILRLLTGDGFIAYTAAAACSTVVLLLYSRDRMPFYGLFKKILNALSLYTRFTPFTEGLLDLSGIAYFLSVIIFMLFLTTQVLEKRRWI